eukprot:sb/3474615/
MISDEILTKTIDSLIDELTTGLLLQFNRAKVLGYFNELEESEDESPIVKLEGRDIFGQPKEVKSVDIDCPECSRSVAATRFAPHLEKCMGMGRNSSRVARRRIANVNHASLAEDDPFEDDEETGKSKRARIRRNG